MILASRSPQRRAILEQLGVEFRVEEPDVDELAEGDPRRVVQENALRKARAIGAPSGPGGTPPCDAPPELVLGADTAVVLEGHIFGKPAGEAEAEAFLTRLSGHAHEVMTGIAVREVDGAEATDVAVTRVRFRPLDGRVLAWYLSSGEWRERAGAYAIQGKGAALVEEIEGDYWNVVGLPVAALLRLVPDLLEGR